MTRCVLTREDAEPAPGQRAVLYLTIINDVCITLWVILTLLRQTKCIYRDILLRINVFLAEKLCFTAGIILK